MYIHTYILHSGCKDIILCDFPPSDEPQWNQQHKSQTMHAPPVKILYSYCELCMSGGWKRNWGVHSPPLFYFWYFTPPTIP